MLTASRGRCGRLMDESGCMQIHCENTEALVDAQQRTFAQGFTGPEGHYISRPAVLEVRERNHLMQQSPLTQTCGVKDRELAAGYIPHALQAFPQRRGLVHRS